MNHTMTPTKSQHIRHIGLILPIAFWATSPLNAYLGPTHEELMKQAMAKAGELPPGLVLSPASAPGLRLAQGAVDEDDPATRALDHAFNPVNNGAFPFSTVTAGNAAASRWNRMNSAFIAGNRDGGDEQGAWHFLGRASHLLQDMASPLHTYARDHAPIPLVSGSCMYEGYWGNQLNRLREFVGDPGGPLHSSTLDPRALERVDDWTRQRLQHRFDASSPSKHSDDVRGWMEVMDWITYFRTTFWGEVRFGDPGLFPLGKSGQATPPRTTATTFSDGSVPAQENALDTMFAGQVRWRVTWDTDWFYEITDRQGNSFRWMSFTDIDDWSACGRTELNAGGWAPGFQDSSMRNPAGSDDDDKNVRITGRFWFDLRQLGLNSSGEFNRRCYPHRYPNGESMGDDLFDYFGRYLMPSLVRYNAGLLGLANRRVSVRTAGANPAHGFTWSRADNFGNEPSFDTSSNAAQFYFTAKSPVTLQAPAVDQAGQPFERWLVNGVDFPGNTNRILTVNSADDWIPAEGTEYTAVFTPDSDGDGLPDWWETAWFGDALSAQPGGDDDHDGVGNLLEFAFNLDPLHPDCAPLVPGTGTSGLPGLTSDESAPSTVHQFEFLRRKNSGLAYTPTQSTTLGHGSWEPMTGTTTITDIDAELGRVLIEIPGDPGGTPTRFFRVEVALP